MRTFWGLCVLMVAAAMMVACATEKESKTENASDAKMEVVGAAGKAVLLSGGKEVLVVTVPAETQYKNQEGSLHLKWHESEFDIWLVSGATTIDQGVAHVAEQIKDEFKKFKPTKSNDLTIAGSLAKQLIGKGVEADDGDDGKADVVVFKVGNHIFVACVHGESLFEGDEQWMLTVLKTARER